MKKLLQWARDIKEFLSIKPELENKILSRAQKPLKEATYMNATRYV
ncbi:MAG: hypothetical protein LBV23_04335 [Deltaproteobacteria bacterium]|nr:hypothetical protein [Deltaproteobacteria bacterium]